jgi:hypothetical protein
MRLGVLRCQQYTTIYNSGISTIGYPTGDYNENKKKCKRAQKAQKNIATS